MSDQHASTSRAAVQPRDHVIDDHVIREALRRLMRGRGGRIAAGRLPSRRILGELVAAGWSTGADAFTARLTAAGRARLDAPRGLA